VINVRTLRDKGSLKNVRKSTREEGIQKSMELSVHTSCMAPMIALSMKL